MILGDMIKRLIRTTNTTDDVTMTNNTYEGDAAAIVNLFIDGLNSAKNKVAQERFAPVMSQTFFLDNNRKLSLKSVILPVLKIKEFRDSSDNLIKEVRDTETLSFTFDGMAENDAVTVYYSYIPADLSLNNLSAEFDFPHGVVDDLMLINFAAYHYHLVKGGDTDLYKTGYFISLFNDAFNKIKPDFSITHNVNKR